MEPQLTAGASSPNQVSLFKEVAIKFSISSLASFSCLQLLQHPLKTSASRELSKGTEGSSSLKNLEHVLIWMKCRQQEKRRNREGGERSTLKNRRNENRLFFSVPLFLKAISPFINNIRFRDVFEQLGPMASEQTSHIYKPTWHTIEVTLQKGSDYR